MNVDKNLYISSGESMAYQRQGKKDGSKILLLRSPRVNYSSELLGQLEESYDVLVLHLRGCGQSSYLRSFDSFAELAVDVAEAISLLGFSDCYVAGSALGGAVALELSLRLPSIKGCILVGSLGVSGYSSLQEQPTPTALPDLIDYSQRRMRRFSGSLLPWPADLAKPNPLDLASPDYDLALLHFNLSQHTNGISQGSTRLAQLRCPVLVLHGINDPVVKPSSWQESQISAQVRLLDNCGDYPYSDCKEEVLQAISRFVG
jgi:2-hydroxy-6-oxonona-2,4-dienedioate hydrolase